MTLLFQDSLLRQMVHYQSILKNPTINSSMESINRDFEMPYESLNPSFQNSCFAVSTNPGLLYYDPYLILIKPLHWKTYLKPNFQFSSFNLAFPPSVIPLLQLCRGDVLLYPVSKKLSLYLSTGCVGDIWGSSFPYAKEYRHNMEFIGGKLTSKLRSSRAHSLPNSPYSMEKASHRYSVCTKAKVTAKCTGAPPPHWEKELRRHLVSLSNKKCINDLLDQEQC